MKNLRQIVHSAYTFIRSIEANKAASGITLDHLIFERIQSIKKDENRFILDSKGEAIGTRPSRLDQLDELEESLNSVISAVQNAGNDPAKLEDLGLEEG
jgi:hypothetical protein